MSSQSYDVAELWPLPSAYLTAANIVALSRITSRQSLSDVGVLENMPDAEPV